MDDLDNLKKLKVPELKQALKDKGLSTTGTKPELIKRLQELDKPSIDNCDAVLDEDEILKDDPAPSSSVTPSASSLIPEEAENTANGISKDSEPKVQMAADTTAEDKPQDVKKLTEAERLKIRAEKFGVTSEQAKKELRAQRFGSEVTENKSVNKTEIISSTVTAEDVEKLKKRAERFGVSTSTVTEDEKKRKRAERFGTSLTTSTTTTTSKISLNSTDSELEAKKRKRAERFGLT